MAKVKITILKSTVIEDWLRRISDNICDLEEALSADNWNIVRGVIDSLSKILQELINEGNDVVIV